jgi:sortase A
MVSRIVGGIGRTLMTAGTLLLLLVAYQLWGTGILEARSQSSLRGELERQLAEAGTAVGEPAPTTEASGPDDPDDPDRVDVVEGDTLPRLPIPDYGDPVGEIRLPTIGVTRVVVSGIGLDQLARGPGHYPESPLPGQAGNVAIAGHRTTFGQPFHNVDKLEPGDQILTTTVQGEFVYEVEALEIVKPDEVRVLEDQGDDRLTLIACHPKYSLAERIIVHAVLVGSPAPEIEGQAEIREAAIERGAGDPFEGPTSIDQGLSGTSEAVWPAVLWALACAAVWFLTWLAQRYLRRRRLRTAGDEGARHRYKPTLGQRLVPWSPYLVGVPIFLVTLFVFFEHSTRFLPGNY